MCDTISLTAPLLPKDRPRYLMGVGKPIDIVEAVARGVDMFDCVLPTRSGRHGQAWTWDGPSTSRTRSSPKTIRQSMRHSTAPASRDYSKAYLNHLFKAGEYLGPMLLSWHNIAFFQAMMAAMRQAISEGRFEAWRADDARPLAAPRAPISRAEPCCDTRSVAPLRDPRAFGSGAAGGAHPSCAPTPFR